MLELKNISKMYKPKKGVPVKALKDLSLSFDAKGMVFVLGKSGSGKSTLLNLIGGLDFADSGEIIIDGKSSKDFKPSDYDSYRNTYIGFVFQEYNILNEFTVGENVSLALELQNLKDNKQRVEDILKEVDLEGYADRKSNELSGGQKQRVAIARAIVKAPKIIMADEPTGALDSETGKAIFETLKKLSQDRLVIVVSHDREFAEIYGDRIIELADGEVINDEIKNTQNQDSTQSTTNDLSSTATQQFKNSHLPYNRALAMGAKTLRHKRFRLAVAIILCFFSFTVFGLAATALDYSVVDSASDYLADMYQDCIIVKPGLLYEEKYKRPINSASYNDLQKLREQTGIDFQGVIQTNCARYYSYYDEDLLGGKYYSQDIGGALPAMNELFDTLGYTLYGELPENEKEIVITKYIFDKMSIAGLVIDDKDTREETIIYPGEIKSIQSFLDRKIYLVSRLTGEKALIVGIVDTKFDPDGRYNIFKEYAELDTKDGKMKKLSQEFEDYLKYGYFNVEFVNPQSYQQLVDSAKTQIYFKYARETDGRLYLDGQNYMARFAGVASDEFIRNAGNILWIDGKGERRELANNEIILGVDIALDALYPPNEYSNKNFTHSKTYFDDLVSLNQDVKDYNMRNGGAGEVALLEEAENISLQELEKYKDYCKQINYVFDGMSYFMRDGEGNLDINSMQEKHWRWSYACYLDTSTLMQGNTERIGGYYDNVTGRQSGQYIFKTLGDRWYLNYKLTTSPASAKKINPQKFDISYDSLIYDLSQIEFVNDPVIVGVYFPSEDMPGNFVVNNKMYEESEYLEKNTFTYLIAPKTANKVALKKLAGMDYDISQPRSFMVLNCRYDDVTSFNNVFAVLTPILLVGAGVLGLFSILLMGNYIAASITAQKKQIGILRALGATKKDIFAIFANESAIIAGITLVLSAIGTLILCLVFNAVVSALNMITLNVLHFGILQLFLLALISVGVAVIASAIPLYKLSRKKPVDSIQDR